LCLSCFFGIDHFIQRATCKGWAHLYNSLIKSCSSEENLSLWMT
jgi:hypothetical protein